MKPKGPEWADKGKGQSMAFEIHDYVDGVIRCERCHKAMAELGRIPRRPIFGFGAGRDAVAVASRVPSAVRFERVEAEGFAICDECESRIES